MGKPPEIEATISPSGPERGSAAPPRPPARRHPAGPDAGTSPNPAVRDPGMPPNPPAPRRRPAPAGCLPDGRVADARPCAGLRRPGRAADSGLGQRLEPWRRQGPAARVRSIRGPGQHRLLRLALAARFSSPAETRPGPAFTARPGRHGANDHWTSDHRPHTTATGLLPAPGAQLRSVTRPTVDTSLADGWSRRRRGNASILAGLPGRRLGRGVRRPRRRGARSRIVPRRCRRGSPHRRRHGIVAAASAPRGTSAPAVPVPNSAAPAGTAAGPGGKPLLLCGMPTMAAIRRCGPS